MEDSEHRPLHGGPVSILMFGQPEVGANSLIRRGEGAHGSFDRVHNIPSLHSRHILVSV